MTDLRTRDDLAGSVRARRGAHRAAPSRLLALVPVLLVAAAVGVLAVGVALLTGFGGGATSPSTVAASSVDAPAAVAEPLEPAAPTGATAPAATGAPTGGAAPAPSGQPSAASSPSAEPSGDAPPPATAEELAAADEDLTDVPLVVLNATRTSGLAASTARTLEREGWRVASTGNERGDAVEATVVRYPDADLEAAALAVAATLGGDVEVVLDDDAEADAVTVVAGPDQDRDQPSGQSSAQSSAQSSGQGSGQGAGEDG